MTTLEACNAYTEDFLQGSGFPNRKISDFDLRVIESTDSPEGRVNFSVYGDRHAPKVILESAPFFTSLHNTHFMLRLATQQEVLGPDYCVVGVQAYTPDHPFSKADKRQMSQGSFKPFSTRMLRVADRLNLGEDQEVAFYGYSLGGDVAIQTAYDAHTNPNRGVVSVSALGAVEYARSINRGLKVARALLGSSDRFKENILASGCDALNEAWSLGPTFEAKAGISFKDVSGNAKYLLGNLSANMAIIKGFGTDKSTWQLLFLLDHTELPAMIGRQSESQLIPEDVAEWLKSSRAIYFEEANDHSADDNIKASAARILYFARTAVAA